MSYHVDDNGAAAEDARRESTPMSDDGPLDGIKTSLNHIEQLLCRGHQLLYDEQGGDDLSPGGTTGDEEASGLNQHAYDSDYHVPNYLFPQPAQKSHAPSAVAAQKASRATNGSRRSPSHNQPTAGERTPSATSQSWLYRHDQGGGPHRLSGNSRRTSPRRSRSRSNTLLDSSSLSISQTAIRLSKLREEGERLPNLEEGVDESDTPQDVTLDAIRARIHRELEEYRRNGPIMKRRASHARPAATRAPPPPPPPAAAPASHATASNAPIRQTPTRPQRTNPVPSRPRAVQAPRATSSQPVSKVQAQRTAAGNTPASAPQAPRRVPVWERLYNNAASQQERQRARRDYAHVPPPLPQPKRHATAPPGRRRAAQPQPRTTSQPMWRPVGMQQQRGNAHHDPFNVASQHSTPSITPPRKPAVPMVNRVRGRTSKTTNANAARGDTRAPVGAAVSAQQQRAQPKPNRLPTQHATRPMSTAPAAPQAAAAQQPSRPAQHSVMGARKAATRRRDEPKTNERGAARGMSEEADANETTPLRVDAVGRRSDKQQVPEFITPLDLRGLRK